MPDWLHQLVEWFSFVLSFSAIGSILIKMFDYIIIKPRNRFKKEIQDENNQVLKDTLTPLKNSVDKLTATLNHLSDEQKSMKSTLTEHDNRLDNHDIRIAVLEKG